MLKHGTDLVDNDNNHRLGCSDSDTEEEDRQDIENEVALLDKHEADAAEQAREQIAPADDHQADAAEPERKIARPSVVEQAQHHEEAATPSDGGLPPRETTTFRRKTRNSMKAALASEELPMELENAKPRGVSCRQARNKRK